VWIGLYVCSYFIVSGRHEIRAVDELVEKQTAFGRKSRLDISAIVSFSSQLSFISFIHLFKVRHVCACENNTFFVHSCRRSCCAVKLTVVVMYSVVMQLLNSCNKLKAQRI